MCRQADRLQSIASRLAASTVCNEANLESSSGIVADLLYQF